MSNKFIYLDNNGTTTQNKKSIDITCKWMKECGNPATDNPIGIKSKELIIKSKKYILNHCGVNNDLYNVIFTSGGTESNCFIIRSILQSYENKHSNKPHIIISAIEHTSIIECCELLKKCNKIELDLIKPNNIGIIEPDNVKNKIKRNTCLISIMYSNNEIGSINDIKKIGSIAKLYKIPFHTDAVQYFGKSKINLKENNIDAISVSFHKLYSPKGIGLLILSNDLIKNYKLEGIINGTQQNGLRGGTENVPLIAGAIAGMVENFKNREEKNKKLLEMRSLILDKIDKIIPLTYFSDYINLNIKNDIMIVIFGPKENNMYCYVPNTILLSVVSHNNNFCNAILKKDLQKFKVIVSIGSACSTDNKLSSHVLTSLNANKVIKQGTIRISLGDTNSIFEIKRFILILFKCINNQIPILDFISNENNKSKHTMNFISKVNNIKKNN